MNDVYHLMRSSVSNIYRNKYRYFVTSVLLQVLLMTVGRYVLSSWFRFGLSLAGVSSITKENVWDILGQTGPFLIMVSYLILVAGFIFLEYVCLIYMVTSSIRNVEFRDLIKASFNQLLWLSGPQLTVFGIYLLLMIPVGNVGLSTTLLDRFKIPAFIMGELTKTGLGSLAYYAGLGVILYLNLRFIYFLPLSVMNEDTPFQNIRQSWQLTRKHLLKLIAAVGGLNLLVFSLGLLLTLIFSLFFGLLDGIWDSIFLQTIFYSLVRGTLYLVTFLNRLILVDVLVNHLLEYDQNHPEVAYVTLARSEERAFRYPKWSRILLVLTLAGAVVYSGLQIYLVSRNPNVLMIAHRGDITAGVENSIEALEAAHQKGSDLVEMDVVLSADDQLVVIHDDSLQRLANRGDAVSDLTLKELEAIEIVQGEFSSQIVSLKTYAAKAKALGQPLLIELKPYGHEPDNYVDLVVGELTALELSDKDRVMSLDLGLMEAIEQKAPELTTGYVIPFQFGHFDDHEVDFYVIEDFSYNDLIVYSAESQGKELFVWTINDPALMGNYLQSPVDGIITDDLALFKEEQADIKKDDSYFSRALRLLALWE